MVLWIGGNMAGGIRNVPLSGITKKEAPVSEPEDTQANMYKKCTYELLTI